MTHSPSLLDISIFRGQREEVASGGKEHAAMLFENKRLDSGKEITRENEGRITEVTQFLYLETEIERMIINDE